MEEKQIKALITLLEDPDTDVFEVIEQQLLNKGVDVVPDLERVWKESLSELLHKRVEKIIGNIHFNDVQHNFSDWVSFEKNDLLNGAYYLAKFQYPELDKSDISKKLSPIINDVKLELGPYLTNLEKVKVINHILYEVHKFTGNTLNFYSPQNCFLNQVLDSKKGNTVSLGILYEIIAQSLDLPVYAVNLPQNLILAYLNKKIDPDADTNYSYDVLFYINPFNRGAVLGKKEIDYFLAQQKVEKKISYYIPCKNIIVIKRLINNLIFAYEKSGITEKVAGLRKLEIMLSKPDNPLEEK